MQPPLIVLPKPQTLFQQRAARFRELAKAHASLSDYLNLMAELADCQHTLAKNFLDTLFPVAYSKSPVDISNWQPDSVWREALHLIVEHFKPEDGPLALIRNRIHQAKDDELETWADWLLTGEVESLDPGLAPFLGTALQTYWVSLAARLDVEKIRPPEIAYVCPVCGSLPVASVLQTGGSIQGLRYLCCGLCATEWNRTRIDCIHCATSKGMAYFGVEGKGDVVKAEACSECNIYIKLMNREKMFNLDPCADDLATLSLDMLMAEEGYQRLGFNLCLIAV